MDAGQNLVFVSLFLLAILALLLAVSEARRFRRQRLVAHLYWSIGLGLVFFTLFEEAVFYAGVWSDALIRSYLFLVAALVGVLSLGSAEVGMRPVVRRLYAAYVVATSAAVAFYCLTEPVSQGILTQGVVTGFPGLGIVLSSTALTVPAAAIMVVVSVLGAWRQHRWRLAYVAAGIVVISIAGALYVVQFPVTLYYAEFVGVILLYLGFGGVRPSTVRTVAPSATSHGS